jgi:hypothetical protein
LSLARFADSSAAAHANEMHAGEDAKARHPGVSTVNRHGAPFFRLHEFPRRDDPASVDVHNCISSQACSGVHRDGRAGLELHVSQHTALPRKTSLAQQIAELQFGYPCRPVGARQFTCERVDQVVCKRVG